MNDLSRKTILEHLLRHGLVRNGDVDELFANGVDRFFFNHGLGHQLGLDVHDVGIVHLRGNGLTVQENMIITVEPGI